MFSRAAEVRRSLHIGTPFARGPQRIFHRKSKFAFSFFVCRALAIGLLVYHHAVKFRHTMYSEFPTLAIE